MSNLVSGTLAQQLTGSAQPFAVRPEKIYLVAPEISMPENAYGAIGHIQDVIYLGMSTRYRVQLPAGALTVVEQNRDRPRWQAGDRVRLFWEREHMALR